MKRTRHMNQHMLAPVGLWKFAFSPQGLSAKGARTYRTKVTLPACSASSYIGGLAAQALSALRT